MTECKIKEFFFKVHLTPIVSRKRIYLLFEILLRNNFWNRLNPRFSVPRRNLKTSFKTLPFCFSTEFEENGSSGCCDVYKGRLNTSILTFSSGWCNTHSKSEQKRLSEVLSDVAAISQISRKMYCTIYRRWSVNRDLKIEVWQPYHKRQAAVCGKRLAVSR